jgi:hypothetical protein
MEIVYSLGGRPFKVDGDRVWDRDGRYVGRILDGMVFDPSGTYLGEFRTDRLAYRLSHANKRKGSHMPRMDRTATSRMDRMARMTPSGWEEFHG